MINIKLRLQNKYTLIALISGVVGLIYIVLGWFNIVPRVSESDITNALLTVVDLLVLMGVINDSSSKGFSDSDFVMGLSEPYSEKSSGGKNEKNKSEINVTPLE